MSDLKTNLNPDEPLYTSSLGTPVMGNLEIEAGSYLDENGNTIQYQGLRIDAVEFTVNNTKNIIEAKVSGLDDTVKEFISGGEYTITVKGIICSNLNGSYPAQAVQILQGILKARAAITVNNTFFLGFGISQMVVSGYSMNRGSSEYSQQPFSFTAKSDKPAILFITQ